MSNQCTVNLNDYPNINRKEVHDLLAEINEARDITTKAEFQNDQLQVSTILHEWRDNVSDGGTVISNFFHSLKYLTNLLK